MCIPVHSPWLPGYNDVMQTILVILTMAGLFLDRLPGHAVDAVHGPCFKSEDSEFIFMENSLKIAQNEKTTLSGIISIVR